MKWDLLNKSIIENFEVKDISVFKNSRNDFCLKIIYEFEEKNGDKYELELPELPLKIVGLPYIDVNPGAESLSDYTTSTTTLPVLKPLNDCKIYVSNNFKFYIMENDIDSDYFFKIKTLKREMTHEEIEKELGYKVKIITKKKNKKE